jgi:hypothetical protein
VLGFSISQQANNALHLTANSVALFERPCPAQRLEQNRGMFPALLAADELGRQGAI